MKQHGARCSVQGADHLARLFAAKGNGEWPQKVCVTQAFSEEQVRRVIRCWGRKLSYVAGEGSEGKMPALQGCCRAARVKDVLRELSRYEQRLW